MELLKHFLLLFINSYIIWKVCDSFQAASIYLGRKMPAGTRGATINAIGSSFPEFMTSFIAIFNYTDNNGVIFGIANTTGSVMYNITMIPFFVILTCFICNSSDKLNFNRNILIREGLFLIFIQLVLMSILSSGEFNLLNSIILVGIYALYIYVLFNFPKRTKHNSEHQNEETIAHPEPKYHRLPAKRPFIKAVFDVDLFSIFFPKAHIATAFNTMAVLCLSILIFYFTCNVLVSSSYAIGEILNIPSYLVAITVTAFATSVPDTILSIYDAKNGHFDDSLTNAFGSNVFNISFCIAFPLLIYILVHGGHPITFDPSSIASLNNFKTVTNILMVIIVSAFIFFPKSWKSIALCLLISYSVFLYSVYTEASADNRNNIATTQTQTETKSH